MSGRILPLALEGVTLKIDGRRLIDKITLTLDAGPLTVVMGPNGAGKSLLMRLCHGLIKPTKGSITWQGSPGVWPGERQTRVFQKPVVLRRSVLANVEYPLKLRGVDANERKVRAREALERTGLGDIAMSPARVLSGGEQQKLAIARAWAMEPEVLFLDEPTANLDPAGTRDVEDLVRAVHGAGTKIIMTSHRTDQVRRLASEVVFIHKGRLIEKGPADAFLDTPQSAEARAYLSGELLV